MLAYADFASRADEAFPIVGTGRKLTREKNLDAPLQEITSGRILPADGLSACTFAAAIKPGGKHAGVVKYDKVARLKQVGQVAELAVGVAAVGPTQVKHSRAIASRERLLSNKFVGKKEMKVGNQHDVDYKREGTFERMQED